jgi:hypothetical protein
MGNAADMVLTPKTADDAAGTNAAALAYDVPVWVDNARQTNAKAHTVADAAGTFVVVFAIPSDIIPEGKFVGLSCGASDVANFLSVVAFKDTYYSA